MQTLYFRPVVSSFFFFLFSAPNLNRRRLDVYHTSTNDVALVRIWNACLKCAARDSPKIQDEKYRQLEMWANAQRHGRPAEHRWRPLFNAAKFG